MTKPISPEPQFRRKCALSSILLALIGLHIIGIEDLLLFGYSSDSVFLFPSGLFLIALFGSTFYWLNSIFPEFLQSFVSQSPQSDKKSIYSQMLSMIIINSVWVLLFLVVAIGLGHPAVSSSMGSAIREGGNILTLMGGLLIIFWGVSVAVWYKQIKPTKKNLKILVIPICLLFGTILSQVIGLIIGFCLLFFFGTIGLLFGGSDL